MLQHPKSTKFTGSGAAQPKRRGRLTPVRRMRRLLATSLFAGSAVLGGMADLALSQQQVAPVAYNSALRGHGGHGHCQPACPTYSYPHAPHYAPAYPYQPGMPTEAPRTDGQAPDQDAAT